MHHYCILSLVAGQLGERELILVQVFGLLEVCLDFSHQNDFKALASLNSFFKKKLSEVRGNLYATYNSYIV